MPVVPPPPPPPKPVPVPRREDDLLERDDLKHEVHLEPISALGYCRTVRLSPNSCSTTALTSSQRQICNLDDLSPAESVNGFVAASPLRLPGNDLELPAGITPSTAAPQDWGCTMPDRVAIDE